MSTNDFTSNTENKDENEANINKQVSENDENIKIVEDKKKESIKEEEIQEGDKKDENKEKRKESESKIKIDLNQLDEIEYQILKEDYPEYDLSFKVIVIGDSGILIYFYNIKNYHIGVGKSSLSIMATKHQFETEYSATIGFEFFSFNIKFGNLVIKLQIWDTCGQEIYRSLISNFYRNCSLAVIVYSITE